MLKSTLIPMGIVICLLSPASHANNLAEDIIASYASIQSLTCDIRKQTQAPTDQVRTLSHVSYQRPDRIHVESVISSFATDKRRIIANGQTLYYYVEGEAAGFATPIEELDAQMAIELRKVPGTAMDHLMRLRGAPEIDLEGTSEFPIRKAYDMDYLYVILSLDDQKRLTRIEFFKSEAMEQKTAQYDYSAFQHVMDNVWIPCVHKGVISESGLAVEETTRISNLHVNQAIASTLFDPDSFFEGIAFK